MPITVVAALVALAVTGLLTFSRFARSEDWRATVTPLASIIGSGFLISGPLLAKEFGGGAAIAMAALLMIAYAVGAVIRFNIIHVENHSTTARFHDPITWIMRLTQVVLALAYAVSVAYYLKLLAEFCLKPMSLPAAWHVVTSNLIVTAIIMLFTALAFSGGLKKVEHLAHASVSVKLGIIGGLLAGLACWWGLHAAGTLALPTMRFSPASIPMLLGLLITVQGFETSRYLGHAYSPGVRIRTMRQAQWIAAAIYLTFLVLLTPFLGQAAKAQGVAGILDIMAFIAAPLATLVLVGAVSSQLSAAVADSIGSSGLMNEVSRKKLSVQWAFALAGGLSIAVVWLTDPFQVIALSSRAFALFYALQCALAVLVARRTGIAGLWRQIGFVAIGVVCALAALIGAPAE